MRYISNASEAGGTVVIPGSKSHTIRALVLAALASGESRIKSPLDSSDTRSCLDMIRAFGAEVVEHDACWTVRGLGGTVGVPDNVIDTGNSGTSLYFGMSMAALADGSTVFTGDHQIRNRPADGLIEAIRNLGAEAISTRGNGKAPFVITGKMTGGRARVEAVTSQYLSSILISSPFAVGDSSIEVGLLNEKPYVDITLSWLDRLGIKYENHDYRKFTIPGSQRISAFEESIAADFSSATFFMVAAAVTGGELMLRGLDFNDSQGDREVADILRAMGARVEVDGLTCVVKGGELKGGEFDLNAIPDALPALSVAACFAEGETRLVNVPQARLKETDRIAVMCRELAKLGADISERPDGLIIKRSALSGGLVDGHHDHRIVMSLAVAGMAAQGPVEISTAEAVAVTFPTFRELMNSAGGRITLQED